MDATEQATEQATEHAAGRSDANAAPRPDEQARARAYLDLWERHLVHVAVHGRLPAAGTRPPAG